MQVINLGGAGGGSGAGGGTGGGSCGCYPFSPDIARQTRVPQKLPAGYARSLKENFTGNNCDVNEITRARLSLAA